MSPSHRLHGSHSRRRSIGPTCRLRTGRTPGLALLLALLVPGPGWGAERQDGQVADSQVVDTAAVDTLEPDTLPPPEQITQERSATDEEIRNALQALFDRVPSLRGIRVGVEAGVVHLEGRVLDSETLTRAGELASAQEGVLWVENDIALDTSLSRRLEPTWDRLQDLVFGFLARLPLLVVGLLIVLFSLWLGGRLGRWGGPSWIRFKNPFLQNIVGRAIQAVVVLAGLLLALDLMEATALVGAVAGTAGLAGLAVGFAFQDIVQNYLAGLLMAVRQPFDKNDHVLVDSYEGKIVRLTPRETILMTLDGNHVRVPNALVFRSPMTNFTRNPRRRFQFDAGVGPGDHMAHASRGGIQLK
ncbi:MAG: mechanosensitive ion channel [Gemmatimonadota bacterium]